MLSLPAGFRVAPLHLSGGGGTKTIRKARRWSMFIPVNVGQVIFIVGLVIIFIIVLLKLAGL